jgi:ADP-heptose:LPS heptosyltransferase
MVRPFEVMTNRFRSFSMQLYNWRQRQPLMRFGAAALLLLVWPFKLIVDAILKRFKQTHQLKRVVVIQLAGLGDMLMLTPTLAALKTNYPDAKIDFITLHDYVRDAFQDHPRLDQVTALPAYQGKWIVSKFVNLDGAKLLLATMRCYPILLLRHLFVRYDVGINFGLSDFDRNLGNGLLYLLNAQRRVGCGDEQLLTDCVRLDGPPAHRAATYLKFLKPLGISGKSQNYEFALHQTHVNRVKATLRSAGINSFQPLAVIHPGGKLHVNSRRWPADYFARVCQSLGETEGFQIVLTGDEADIEVCEKIAAAAGVKTISIAGRLTFAETAALLSLCQLFITNDTSTLHLAEAVEVPRVISIFGPTDPALLAPQSERHIVFRSKLPCAPCMGGLIDANTERCWREVKEECLLEISPAEVIAVVRQYSERTAVRAARA